MPQAWLVALALLVGIAPVVKAGTAAALEEAPAFNQGGVSWPSFGRAESAGVGLRLMEGGPPRRASSSTWRAALSGREADRDRLRGAPTAGERSGDERGSKEAQPRSGSRPREPDDASRRGGSSRQAAVGRHADELPLWLPFARAAERDAIGGLWDSRAVAIPPTFDRSTGHRRRGAAMPVTPGGRGDDGRTGDEVAFILPRGWRGGVEFSSARRSQQEQGVGWGAGAFAYGTTAADADRPTTAAALSPAWPHDEPALGAWHVDPASSLRQRTVVPDEWRHERVEVTWPPTSAVATVLSGTMDAEDTAFHAFGRTIDCFAGLEVRAGRGWACRLGLEREFLNQIAEPTTTLQVSLGMQLRF